MHMHIGWAGHRDKRHHKIFRTSWNGRICSAGPVQDRLVTCLEPGVITHESCCATAYRIIGAAWCRPCGPKLHIVQGLCPRFMIDWTAVSPRCCIWHSTWPHAQIIHPSLPSRTYYVRCTISGSEDLGSTQIFTFGNRAANTSSVASASLSNSAASSRSSFSARSFGITPPTAA